MEHGKALLLNGINSFFANDSIMNALKTTLVLAVISAFIATVIGVVACLAINRMNKVPRAILTSITNIPMLNAE